MNIKTNLGAGYEAYAPAFENKLRYIPKIYKRTLSCLSNQAKHPRLVTTVADELESATIKPN